MVLSGFLLHHVLLDCDSGAVRNRRSRLQEAEGTFRRCAVEAGQNRNRAKEVADGLQELRQNSWRETKDD